LAGDRGDFQRVAADSRVVAGWTMVSRITGLGRVVCAAAVLGPTFFGNIFQASNYLPNLIYGLVGGRLIASLLVPTLTRSIDAHRRADTDRLAGGFLGTALLGFGAATALVLVTAPLFVYLFTFAIDDPVSLSEARRVASLLLFMLIPQVVLYGVAYIGAAVQNAHGRFAWAAAAPVLENFGVMATLIITGLAYGTGLTVTEVTDSHVLILGFGTTAAVGLHALAQLLAVQRLGLSLRPRAGWRDPELRSVFRLAIPSLGIAGLTVARQLGATVVAGTVSGGVLAYQIGVHFYNLPVAIGAQPVATAVLPRLARAHTGDDRSKFRHQFVEAIALSSFVTIPAALAFVILGPSFAKAISVGQMANDTGVDLVTAAIASLGLGVIGTGAFFISREAAYAQRDATSPLKAMALAGALTLVGFVAAFATEGTLSIALVGLAISIGDLAAATYLYRRVLLRLPAGPSSRQRLVQMAAVSVVTVAVAAAAATLLSDHLQGTMGAIAVAAIASGLGLAIYGSLHALLKSPELQALRGTST
jgi:putative peptidoglycan lipid II flippase